MIKFSAIKSQVTERLQNKHPIQHYSITILGESMETIAKSYLKFTESQSLQISIN